MSYKNGIFSLIMILFSHLLLGQESISKFLRSSTEDIALKGYEDQINFLNQHPYGLSLIRNLQLKAQNNRMGTNRNKYGVSLTFSNPWEMSNNTKFFKSYQSSLKLERELAFKEILATRYYLILDLVHQQEVMAIRKELVNNIENQLLVFEEQKSSSFFKSDDYIEAKLKEMQQHTDFETEFFQTEQKIREIKQLDPTIETLPDWSYNAIISIDQLSQTIDSLMNLELYTTTSSFHQQRIELKERAYKLERSNFNLGTFQSTYSPFRLEKEQSPLGLSIGLNIPLFNPNKGDMAKKRMDQLMASNEMDTELQSAKIKVKNLVAMLKSHMERYNNVDKKITSFDIDETFSTVGALNDNNPIILLKFQEQLLKLKKLKADLALEIYRSYVDFLSTTDLIQKEPFINFLSTDLKSF